MSFTERWPLLACEAAYLYSLNCLITYYLSLRGCPQYWHAVCNPKFIEISHSNLLEIAFHFVGFEPFVRDFNELQIDLFPPSSPPTLFPPSSPPTQGSQWTGGLWVSYSTRCSPARVLLTSEIATTCLTRALKTTSFRVRTLSPPLPLSCSLLYCSVAN